MKLSHLFLASLLVLGLSVSAYSQTTSVQPMGMAQPGGDRRHQIYEGITKIDRAYQHLAIAGDDWGGHREAAMKDLMAAKQELQIALDFENQQLGR
jgi:Spy/CpxP family protein refolding chaperone